MEFFFHLKKADTILTEEEARIWRYSYMINLSKQLNINYIVTGHTQDDKIETMLYNIVKGSGFEGATSIQNISKITKNTTLVHPILNLNREETNWFCNKMCIPIWFDITNYNYTISRNRIRQELVPYLKKYFNSNFELSITKFVDNIKYDLQYLQKKSYYLYLKYKHPNYVAFNKSMFLDLAPNMKKRFLRIFIYTNSSIKINFVKTNECITFLKNSMHKTKKISPKLYLYSNHHWVYLITKEQNKEFF
uniref:tRNA(Ile)-lysidine synthase n=1 Tax=Pseudoerythrocladia kornmannii TaxID=753682 RepID=UPI001FCD6E30|nr:tRNA(Ile)-lysidine synthase [Pseudoerythrocladia kornmannii]UNJ16695.1 tRNA(Ile)-lysidine synthase [Pseudoerythrocladia kornmannii]